MRSNSENNLMLYLFSKYVCLPMLQDAQQDVTEKWRNCLVQHRESFAEFVDCIEDMFLRALKFCGMEDVIPKILYSFFFDISNQLRIIPTEILGFQFLDIKGNELISFGLFIEQTDILLKLCVDVFEFEIRHKALSLECFHHFLHL